jgi:WD40 repeat protein
LWDLTEGKPRRTPKGHKAHVDAVAFSKDGRWLATSGRTAKEDDYEVLLWDAEKWEVKQTFRGLTEWVHVVAFSPDGKILAVCGGGGGDVGNQVKTAGELTFFPLKPAVVWSATLCSVSTLQSGKADIPGACVLVVPPSAPPNWRRTWRYASHAD